jgi:hypothetical protein
VCQEAAYLGLRAALEEAGARQGADAGVRSRPPVATVVAVASGSVSLLALVAKSRGVRERHAREPSRYGLGVPIRCLELSLEAARRHQESSDDGGGPRRQQRGGDADHGVNKDGDPRGVEQQYAELARKGCLLLGALSSSTGEDFGGADGGGATSTDELASLVVQEGGMRWIVDALSWFRYHSDVANWALWALFTVCYEHPPRKSALLELEGIPAVLRAMRHCPDTVEVARHGTALLFDLLREPDNDGGGCGGGNVGGPDPWKVRRVALGCGLHSVLVQNMATFPDEMDIMMMSQEILVGTDYPGDIPQYRPTR